MSTTTEPSATIFDITYKDGRSDVLDVDAPLVQYQASLVSDSENPRVMLFILLWCAAGRPGMDVYANPQEAIETWLGGIQTWDRRGDDPPTTPEPPA